jgi:hypothetical protein
MAIQLQNHWMIQIKLNDMIKLKFKHGRTLVWNMLMKWERNKQIPIKVGRSHHTYFKPVTPAGDNVSSDEDMKIPSSSHKHPANVLLHGESATFQKMDDDPVVAPKSKAARTDGDVHQVAEVEVCHNDEPEVMVDDWEDRLHFPDSGDE